jgi:hypothetical protein
VKCVLIMVGCLECGIKSEIVGVFGSREEADRIATALERGYNDEAYVVFDLLPEGVIAAEFMERLEKGD